MLDVHECIFYALFFVLITDQKVSERSTPFNERESATMLSRRSMCGGMYLVLERMSDFGDFLIKYH